jgi:hypothetical protein
VRIIVVLLLICGTAAAKAQQPQFRTRYGSPVSETYRVRPDVRATIYYDGDGQVCKMLIKPQRATPSGGQERPTIEAARLTEVLDGLIPKDERGKLIRSGAYFMPANPIYRKQSSLGRWALGCTAVAAVFGFMSTVLRTAI